MRDQNGVGKLFASLLGLLFYIFVGLCLFDLTCSMHSIAREIKNIVDKNSIVR